MNRRWLVLGAVAAACFAFLRFLPRRRRVAEEFSFLTINGKQLHYTVMGDSGPVVVLLHGASGQLQDWTFRVAPLLAQDHRVVIFDRPGLGLSDALDKPEDLGAQAQYLSAAVAALGYERYTLVGHSFGGSVALRMALERPAPIAGLCLISAPSHRWETPIAFYYEWANTPLIGDAIAQVLPRLANEERIKAALRAVFEPQPVPDGYLDHINPELTLRPEVFAANAKQIGALRSELTAMQTRYADMTIPTELIHGDRDDVVFKDIHSDALAQTLTNVRYTPLAGMGHAPHNTAPDVVEAAIRRLTGQGGV